MQNRLTIGTSDESVPALALTGNKDPDFGRPHDDGGADDANYGTNGPRYIRIIRQNYWRALRPLPEPILSLDVPSQADGFARIGYLAIDHDIDPVGKIKHEIDFVSTRRILVSLRICSMAASIGVGVRSGGGGD